MTTKVEELLKNTGDMALKRRALKIIEGLDLKKGERILEVGCGDGYYLHILSSLNLALKLYGTDYDLHTLEVAKRNLARRKINLGFGDLMKKLPFPADYFDKVIMSEVAEHLPNDVQGLREVRRVLKPGGILCLTVPNHNYPLLWDPVNWLLEHLLDTHITSGFWAGLWNMHIRLYTKDQISTVISQAGFKIKDVESLTFWSLPFNHNVVNFGARLLHSGKLDQASADSINKFKAPAHRTLIANIYFATVEGIDKLNDLWLPDQVTGVGLFVKALK